MEDSQWQVEISNPARRDLKRLSPDVQRRVLLALQGLAAVPRHGDIKKLRGSANEYRLRVGDWRAIGERRVVQILAVSHRRDAYR